jgi:hypothetical protein
MGLDPVASLAFLFRLGLLTSIRYHLVTTDNGLENGALL